MLLNGVNHVSLLARDTGRVVAFYRESRHLSARRGLWRPAAGDVRRMTATIRPAGLVLAALLLIAGCGGSASTGHTAPPALSCQQQSVRIRDLATQYFYDSADGYQLKTLAELHAARALWGSMHKEHCPASSYAQANRALSGFGISFNG
jgi:hypothetical protein